MSEYILFVLNKKPLYFLSNKCNLPSIYIQNDEKKNNSNIKRMNYNSSDENNFVEKNINNDMNLKKNINSNILFNKIYNKKKVYINTIKNNNENLLMEKKMIIFLF